MRKPLSLIKRGSVSRGVQEGKVVLTYSMICIRAIVTAKMISLEMVKP